MQSGFVKGIFITEKSGEKMFAKQEVLAIEDKGLKGDRYAEKNGTFSKKNNKGQVTLIEAEALIAVERDYEKTIEPAQTRRNILTSGIALNHLVNQQFQIGDIILEGTELCEPCGYLEEKSGIKKLKKALRHRGGIRAKIIRGGLIKVGDTIEVEKS